MKPTQIATPIVVLSGLLILTGHAKAVEPSKEIVVNFDWPGWIEVMDAVELRPVRFTIEAWVTPLGGGYAATPWKSIIEKSRANNTSLPILYSYALQWNFNNGRIRAIVLHDVHTAPTVVESTISVPIGETRHIAMSFDGFALYLYIDGKYHAGDYASSPAVDYDAHKLLIGAGFYNVLERQTFTGRIDEVRIWDHARHEELIATTMNTSLCGTEQGLLAYYSFNNYDATDETGNGNDGSIVNLVKFVESDLPSAPCGVAVPATSFVGVAAASVLLFMAGVFVRTGSPKQIR